MHFLASVNSHPRRSLYLSLDQEKLKHGLVSAENGLESLSFLGAFGKRWLGSVVLNFKEGHFFSWDGHLESVLPLNEFAFPVGYLLQAFVLDFLEFLMHFQKLSFLLRIRQNFSFKCKLRKSIEFSLHSLDHNTAGLVVFGGRHINFAKEVDFGSKVLLMRISPEKREFSLLINRQDSGSFVLLHSIITEVPVLISVGLLDLSPLLEALFLDPVGDGDLGRLRRAGTRVVIFSLARLVKVFRFHVDLGGLGEVPFPVGVPGHFHSRGSVELLLS